jgi:hypothetical protein
MAERADVLSRLTKARAVNDKLWPLPARLGPDEVVRTRPQRGYEGVEEASFAGVQDGDLVPGHSSGHRVPDGGDGFGAMRREVADDPDGHHGPGVGALRASEANPFSFRRRSLRRCA